jgi:hypothetical protein
MNLGSSRVLLAPSGSVQSRGRQRTCILILGMHRSGTSAITKILNLMGAELPKQVLGSKPGNVAGHWEPERLVLLHDQMLAEAGSSWRDPRTLDLARLSPDRLAHYSLIIKTIIQEEFGSADVFVLKDPRICRFIPFYRSVLRELNVQIRPIITIRNPLEVSGSLMARDNMPEATGLLLWLRHCLDTEKETRDMRRIFVSYDQVVNNVTVVIEQLFQSLEGLALSNSSDIRNLAVQFISHDLRHQAKSSHELRYNGLTKAWIKQAYSALRALMTGQGETSAITRLDRISNEFSNSNSLIARLADDLEELRTKLQQHEDDGQLLIQTIAELRHQIQRTSEQHDREIELAALELQRMGEQYASRLRVITEQHAEEIEQNRDRYAHELADLQRVGYEKRLPPELSSLRQWLSGRSKRRRLLVQDYHGIAASPLFDREWYLRQNPDVAASNVDAALHYLQSGGREGRSSGPYFQSNAYLKANPEVAAEGGNPLLHFLRDAKRLKSDDTF